MVYQHPKNRQNGGNMHSVFVRNVSEALYKGVNGLYNYGREVKTRNGLALEFKAPVITEYSHPSEKVLFYPERDANPFFHLMEAFWMLAGRNDVEWISQFNGRINNYSDDGKTFHGAYGYRWKNWFGKDQLQECFLRLSTYENDRRVVLTMWDPKTDLVLSNDGRDYPCNTQIFFWRRDERLHMSIINRSNDMIWGAYGANAVHMAVLQEYMAGMLRIQVGKMYQFSNNLHAYVEVLEKIKNIKDDYENYLTIGDDHGQYDPAPLLTHPHSFDKELKEWFQASENRTDYENIFLGVTATPMRHAWELYKSKNLIKAIQVAKTINDRAWRKACVEWLQRRQK